MLIYHKTDEKTVDLIQVMHGASSDDIQVHRDLPIDHRYRPARHQVQLNEFAIGQVLVTGCSAVGFRYAGEVKSYDFFKNYLNQA